MKFMILMSKKCYESTSNKEYNSKTRITEINLEL